MRCKFDNYVTPWYDVPLTQNHENSVSTGNKVYLIFII